MIRRRLSLALLSCLVCLAALSSPAAAQDFSTKDFQASESCGGCHGDLFEQWHVSMHAAAYSDEIFQKELNIMVSDLGGADNPGALKMRAFCLSCHTPIATLTGDIPPKTPVAAEGVSCDFCHTVSGTTGIGNASYENTPGDVKRGPFVDSISPAHDTTLSVLHTTSEFCGMCHDASSPVNGLPLESTYTEWKSGPYPAENKQCQHCMMGVMKNTAAASMGPKRPAVFKHMFAGGNTVLGPEEETLKRLRGAATITLEVDSASAKPGQEITATVQLTNSGAGHKIPTGISEIRDMRLVIKSVDANNRERVLREERFGTVLEDAQGKHDGTVHIWQAAKIYSDNRLAPKERREYVQAFKIPDDAEGDYRVVAALVYRPLSKEAADNAGLSVPKETEMATAEKKVTLPGGDTEQRAAAPSWPIWLTLGILLVLISGVGAALIIRARK